MAKKTVAKKKAAGADSKDFHPSKAALKESAKRAKAILKLLYKTWPDAKCGLDYKNPLELMVATVLSAQCTDVRVNVVTKDLFKKYRSAKDFAAAEQAELEEDIRSTGFFRNKAKNIIAACKVIESDYKGKVPKDQDALVNLPGIGRKTANVVLGNAFGIPGITTDTHVIRLSRLMGLADESDPVKLEFILMELVPEKDWTMFCHMMITHGRNVCIARRPKCGECTLKQTCCYGQTVEDE